MGPMTYHPPLEWPRGRTFPVVMSSGQAYEIRSPDAAFLTQNDLLAGIDVADDGIPDRAKTCQLCNIIAVEPIGDRRPYP